MRPTKPKPSSKLPGAGPLFVQIELAKALYLFTCTWQRAVSLILVSVKETLPLGEPWPCDPAAETTIQPQSWCFQSCFSNRSSYPEEYFFTSTGNNNNNNNDNSHNDDDDEEEEEEDTNDNKYRVHREFI